MIYKNNLVKSTFTKVLYVWVGASPVSRLYAKLTISCPYLIINHTDVQLLLAFSSDSHQEKRTSALSTNGLAITLTTS